MAADGRSAMRPEYVLICPWCHIHHRLQPKHIDLNMTASTAPLQFLFFLFFFFFCSLKRSFKTLSQPLTPLWFFAILVVMREALSVLISITVLSCTLSWVEAYECISDSVWVWWNGPKDPTVIMQSYNVTKLWSHCTTYSFKITFILSVFFFLLRLCSTSLERALRV